MTEKEEFTSYSHWNTTSNGEHEFPVDWLGLVQQPDGQWIIGCATPWEEVLSEFEETCDMEGRRFVLVSLLDDAPSIVGYGKEHDTEEEE